MEAGGLRATSAWLAPQNGPQETEISEAARATPPFIWSHHTKPKGQRERSPCFQWSSPTALNKGTPGRRGRTHSSGLTDKTGHYSSWEEEARSWGGWWRCGSILLLSGEWIGSSFWNTDGKVTVSWLCLTTDTTLGRINNLVGVPSVVHHRLTRT